MGLPPQSGITQRVILPVKGVVDDWKEPLEKMLLTLKAQPGMIWPRWGLCLEDVGRVELMVGWTSVEARDTFIASTDHEQAIEALKPVLSGIPQAYEIKLAPYAPKSVIDSAVVEIISVWGLDPGDSERIGAQFEIVETMDGCNGVACGFSIKEVADPDGNIRKHGRVWVGAVGWSSLERSLAADKEMYTPSADRTEVFHVNYNFPIQGLSVTNSVH